MEPDSAATVVSKSPLAADMDNPTTAEPQCSKRAAGQVCICTLCEAARTRLLDRRNTASSSSTAAAAASSSTTLEDGPPTKRTRSTTTPAVTNPDEEQLRTMCVACTTILDCIGEDSSREGLRKTPERWAKALLFMCKGYHQTAAEVTNDAVFQENHNEMVVVRNIDIHSLCEHHMLPFSGRVHIGYIPNGQLLGLSKLARIAEVFARRLQVQERLTRQIADAVLETVQPLGVAVVVECTHFCMVMRGVQKTGATTTTSSVRGCFETNPKTRAEFFSILHNGH